MKNRPAKTLKTIADRTAAVLMCTCMISSSVPTTAFAAEPQVSVGEDEESCHTITAWEWIDEEGNLDPETGVLVLSAEEENLCAFEDVEELLPKQITAEVSAAYSSAAPASNAYQSPNEDGAEDAENTEDAEEAENTEDTENAESTTSITELIALGSWECESYPEEGAFRGTYTFRASLPEGYVLSEDAAEPEVEVKFDTPQILDEADGYTEEGFCEGYKWENGSLVKITTEGAEEGETVCFHTDCNGYQPAVQITDANASTYGFTTDADKAKYKGYYAITNAGQLYWFAAYVNGWSDSNDTRTSNAVLTADITVNSSLLSAKLNADGTPKTDADIRSWIPIGYNITDNGSAFQGTFDGQKHTISGICFSDTSADKGAGLFGVLDKGTISKVTLKDSYFKGKKYVGGICGQIGENGGTIDSCTNQATVSGIDEYVGGICGFNNTDSGKTGTISNCANSGAISGVAFFGGICGKFQNGTMKACRNSGDVTGAATSGGIGGICGKFDDNSTVSDCENSGSISGATCVGGICGQSDGNANTITGCKNSGTVTGTATGEEGFIGGICGDNQGAITNCNNLADGAVSVSSGVSCVGGVCGSNVYKLENCTNAATVTGWLVVGGICGYNAANDILQTTITSCTNSGTVKCAEAGETTEGPSYIGGICGWNDRGEQSSRVAYIYSCTNNGAIEASSAGKVGGICGKNLGSISKGDTGTANTNTANVTGGENTGGICGYSEGSVSGTNSGDVTGSGDCVGGVCGYADSSTTISHSCNTGSVSGKKNVGGIAGSVGAVDHVYNTGSVTGTERDSAGVIIGAGTAAKDSCFYLDTILTDEVHATDNETAMTSGDFSSGRVAWLLNDKASDSPTWHQWIDADGKTADASPVLDNTHGVVYVCTPCTSAYSNTAGKTKEHGDFKQCESADTDASSKHICGLCGEKAAHSGVVYKADAENDDTILASCSCGYEYGSIKIKEPDSLTYDGNAKKATIYTNSLDVPVGVTISPSDSDVTYMKIENGAAASLTGQPKAAGAYKATLSLTGDDEESAKASVTYTIAQAAPTVAWDRTECTAYYTGNAISSDNISIFLKVTGVSDTDITDDYDTADYTFSYRKSDSTGAFTDGLPTDLGEYQIKAEVTAKGNYKEAETAGYLTLTVDWFDSASDADLHDQNGNDVSSGTEYWAQSIRFTAPDNFTISQELNGTYAPSFTYQEETGKDGTAVTYYLKEEGSGRIARKTATVYIDRTAPTFPESGDYGIQIKENRFKSLLNTITFGLVYQNSVDVKVLAKEELSGIKEYNYYIDDSGSGTVKTVEALNALKDSGGFTAIANDGFITTLQNNAETKSYVVYAYAVDRAGNRSDYICSNGVVVDDTKPAITFTAPTKDAGTLTDSSAAITLNASEAGIYFFTYKATADEGTAPSAMADFADSATENGKTIWTAKTDIESASMAEGTNTITLTGLDANTDYILYVMAADSVGNTAAFVQSVPFTTLKKMPEITVQPRISGVYGKTLSGMSLINGTAGYNGNPVAGEWAITEAQADSIHPTVNGTTKYEVTFTPDDTTTYESITVKVLPTVSKKPITVTVNDASKDYGEPYNNAYFSFEITEGELVNGDTEDALHITLSCEATKDSPVKEGGYAITGASGSEQYDVTIIPGTLTINKADPELEVTNGTATGESKKVSITKNFGDGSFAIGASSKNNTTPITYQVTGSAASEGGQTATDAVVTVDASGKVTIVGAGKAWITVSQAESTNYKAAEGYTVVITVNKKPAPDDVTITKNYQKSTSTTTIGTLNLNPYLPKDCGSVSYGYQATGWMIGTSSNGETDPKVTDGVLSYTIKSASQSESETGINEGTITVTVRTANYEKFEIILKINLTDYEPIIIEEVIISDVTDTSAKADATVTEAEDEGRVSNYYLYYTDTASGSIDAETIKTNAGNSTANYLNSTAGSFSLTGLKAGTTYYVYIVAEDADGHLGTLQTASFTTKEEPRQPSSDGESGSSGNSESNNSNTNAGSSSSSDEDTTNESPVNGSSTETSTPAPTPVQPSLIPESRPAGEKIYPVYEPEVTDGKNKAPFIKGENGKEGWDVIRTETESTPEGSTVTVDMNGAVAVPGEVLEDIRGRNVTLVFDMGNGITWSVNGQSITGDVTGDIDFDVTMGAQAGRSIPADAINNVTGERYSVNLTLAYEGELGFTAVLTVNMSAENAGLYANLFYYNPSTGELELICYDEIAADGTTELAFTHASDYTIVIDTEPMDGSARDDGGDAVKAGGTDGGSTGESSAAAATGAESAWNPLWIILIGAVVIVIGIGGLFIAKRKRKNIK